jgi:tRNA-dihydrouridine synthase B
MKPVLHFAPLHGVTNYLFRNIYAEFFGGFDFVMAPFIMSVKTKNVRKNHFKDLLPERNTGLKVIPQVLCNEPREFLAISERLADFGYKEVNWNLGCPYKMVANKLRGSGLLPYPEKIESFLETVFSKINIGVSVKIRLGRNTGEEIFRLISVFNKFPFTKIIIHPRTGVQMYKGDVDLDIFSSVYKMFSHRIVYNGDIKNLKIYNDLSVKFPSIGEWMIGRWAISDPFLFEAIKNNVNTVSGKIEKIKTFHDALFNAYKDTLYGPGHLLDKMKEIWNYLYVSFENGSRIHRKLVMIKKVEEYKDAIEKIFLEEKWKA